MEKIESKSFSSKQRNIFEEKLAISLKSIESYKPDDDLLPGILVIINKKTKLAAIRELVILAVLFLVSVAVLAVSGNSLLNELDKAGVSSLMSQLMFDWKIISLYWHEYSMYLLEALPAFPIMAALSSVFAILVIIRFVGEAIHKIFSHNLNHSSQHI